jgi:hypothetical protein
MIQRIQTFYLLLSLVVIGLMFFFPFTIFMDTDAVKYVFDFSGIYESGTGEVVTGTLPFQILLVVVVVINLVTIFLYKNRRLQMRAAVFNMLLMAGLLVLAGWYIYYTLQELQGQVYYRVTLLFPLIGIVLTWLAFRNILKDELLVRSADRLR